MFGSRDEKGLARVHRNGDAEEKVKESMISSLLVSKERDYLLSSTGNQVKISALEHSVVGLYFSANWYPPCKNFNKVLVEVYEQLRSNGANFEIVLLSSDEDSDAFNNYFRHMPWLAIPFSEVETKKALNRKFDIEAIPSLVILQPNDVKGNDILRDGVEHIYKYRAHAFPFTKERLEVLHKEEMEKHERQTLAVLLINNERDYLLGHPTAQQVPVSALVGKTVGLYFSAQWCTPCRNFTPKLVSIYHKIKERVAENGNEDFEIIFLSNDRDQASFDSYFSTMPWLALPFGDPAIKSLARYFDVQGIPWLIIIGPDGKTVTKQGRNLLNLYQEKAYPFTEAQVALLERQMEEKARNLPRSLYHTGHRHELNLVSEGKGGGPFICCDCDEQGLGWAYQCLECGYEVHPRCAKPVDSGSGLDRPA